MKLTRVIVATLIASALGAASAQAQGLRSTAAASPAEFPPASYTGKQYVDSNGCIFIRAGIDGNVTWVPRVTRGRQLVCGYQPSLGGSAPAPAAKPAKAAPKPVEITVAPSAQPSAKPAPVKPKPLPKAVMKPAPVPPRTVQRPAPVATAPQAQPTPIAPRGTPRGGPCSNASSFSQQYINTGPDVRCGPQKEAPVTYGRGWDRNSALSPALGPDTRAVPRHVYDKRQNTTNVAVPEGYRTVWSDDRLNPHRAEYGLGAPIPSQVAMLPEGYRAVGRGDDRLNPFRGGRTQMGEAQMAAIWTESVPRKLVPVPTDRPVVTVPGVLAKSPAEARDPLMMRISTRSAPEAAKPVVAAANRYVRVDTFGGEAEARGAAQSLARSGLPMRLGTLHRGSRQIPVVLAGPFASDAEARRALQQLRAAGYSNARLNS